MTCDTVQRHLLSLNEPQRPPAELRRHLAACFACRRVLGRIVEIEQQVAAIPVPPSTGKDALMHRILTDPTIRASVRDRTRAPKVYRWRPALAAAAALLIGVTALVAVRRPWQSGPVAASPRHPLLAKVIGHDQRLAKANTPVERLAALTDLADDLQGQAGTLARVASPDDLNRLARLYKDVVEKAVGPQADLVTNPDDRQRVLPPLADRLQKAELAAATLAATAPTTAREALQSIAQTAHNAKLRLTRA
jgi:hypothetical protein